MINFRSSRGQSILELLIALGIFTVALTAGFSIFFGGETAALDSVNANLASDYAREGLDALRAIRNRNWSELIEGTSGLYFNGSEWLVSSSSSDSKDIFTRQVAIAKGDSDNIKIATSTVSWESGGRTKLISFVEQFTDWETPSQSSCKTESLTGNWAAPRAVSSADIGSGNEGTDVVADLPYVYVSGESSSGSKPDIFVFNASDINTPNQIASLNIGSGGISAIFLLDNYLYAASPNNTKEFVVFNVSDPANITETASLDLSGNADAISITAIPPNMAVIGREDDADDELVFIDVSNPASPNVIREFASTNNGSVTDLAYTNEYLYATNEQGSNADVMVYDIAAPTNPTYVTTYDIPGSSTGELSIYAVIKGGGTNLLVGNAEDEFTAIGATTTSGMYVRDSLNVGGDVNDIVCVLGNLAFLSTENGGKEFMIININDLNNISEYASLNYPQIATGIDFDNNYVFMSVRSNDALRIITSQ